jgi:hypothetical protein
VGRAPAQTVVLAFLVGVTLGSVACEPRPGKLREQWQRTNGAFQVRVEVFDEGNKAHLFEPGCHVRLAVAPAGTAQWSQFSNAYYSHCDVDLKDRVRFVGAKTGYVFMQWWYSVTTDGGKTWSTWNVPAHLPGRAYDNPRLIESVTLGPDGKGTMTLNPDGTADKARLTLTTDDFGREWHLQ